MEPTWSQSLQNRHSFKNCQKTPAMNSLSMNRDSFFESQKLKPGQSTGSLYGEAVGSIVANQVRPAMARCLQTGIAARLRAATKNIFAKRDFTTQTHSLHARLNSLAILRQSNDLKESNGSMSNLDIAKETLQHIRTEVYKANHKSYNKTYQKHRPKYVQVSGRRKKAHPALLKTRTARSKGAGYVVSYKSQAHNCGELAEAAVYHLRSADIPAFKAYTATHAFAVIGITHPAALPEKICDWPADIAVCDPWANLACTIDQYPAAFSNKMNKWAMEGKLIFYPALSTYVLADQPQWVGSVVGREIKISLDGSRKLKD
ncbi:hypothetical protein [Duganella qianjiadongensis]|uniref:Uncharacterized protein n=1 Tax=Duganella qianjiadongensis TaxID=2692176 RepID=A0ABW9VFT2_9BURK|nr:hypothetical protein [Duganella qianjiadongensis]MYM37891.1 hypothetical protein [Duganella qianjiadongensis]